MKGLFIFAVLAVALPCLSQMPAWVTMQSAATPSVTPPTPDLAWYKFDTGSGTSATDSSAKGNTGTLSGSPLPAWVNGPNANKALSFNGSTAYVDCGTGSKAIVTGISTLSVSCWFSNTASGTIGVMVGSANSSLGQELLLMANTTNGSTLVANQLFFAVSDLIGNGVFAKLTSTSTKVSDGAWHHLVVTFNYAANTMTVYLDNSSTAITYTEQTTPTSFTFVSNLYIGGADLQGAGLYAPFTGGVDDVQIFGHVLTSTEVANIYNAGAQ